MGIKSSLDPENKYLASWTSDDNPCTGSFEGVACNLHNKNGTIHWASLNGTIHWVGNPPGKGGCEIAITTFNTSEELIGKMALPKYDEADARHSIESIAVRFIGRFA
ncbi:hypothetical protein RJ640_008313 [Escallonia rubra]|uniref:Leucine-rich repeat-containing N-terminal plant-type domain-containing protein n=1 Tax=Escallonia rubra TaxID=112253 RepID=A0AA88U2V1_9ASTE|nr:hypothetical protein RJ640_008313 [Escallonia rubra]